MLLGVAAALAVAAPMLFTRNGFMVDFTNHLWLAWSQEHSIAHALYPSYFINTTTGGVFEPFFAFYGGTLYAITGAVAVLLGDAPVVAFVGVATLAIAAAYGGIVWIARQCGARSWMAHAPALAFVTSAYYATDLYGRGDWTEFVAVSAIPLVIASAVHLLRSPRWNVLPTSLLVLSVVIFSGSHNITLAWGTIVLLASVGALWLAVGAPRRVPRNRVWKLLCLAALAVAVNAWFLVPDVLHAADTKIGATSDFQWSASQAFDTPGMLFDPLRRVPRSSTSPALYVQAPVWFLLWGLAGWLVAVREGADRRIRRAYLAFGVVLAALLVLILVGPSWLIVPAPLKLIQFPLRLNTYVALATAALVLLSVLTIERSRGRGAQVGFARTLRLALPLVCGVSVGLCVWQLWVPQTQQSPWSYPDRRAALASIHVLPRTWYDESSFADASEPIVAVAPGRVLYIDPRLVVGDRLTATVTPPPGATPFATNIAAGPYLAWLRGLVRVGRTPDGFVVARRTDAGSGPVRIAIVRAGSVAIIAGSLVSVGAILALLLLLVLAAARGLRRSWHPVRSWFDV